MNENPTHTDTVGPNQQWPFLSGDLPKPTGVNPADNPQINMHHKGIISAGSVPSGGVDSSAKFPCQICGKVYKSWAGRYYHMSYHTGERKHCCTVCGKLFVRGPDCRRHMAAVHHAVYEKQK